MIANMLFYTLHVHIYRKCFVSTDDTQTLRSFVRAASSSHPHLQCAKINDTLWGLYTLGLTKAYCQSAQSKWKTLVSCIGRQPESDVWVFSPSIQVDINGKEVPLHEQEFYW